MLSAICGEWTVGSITSSATPTGYKRRRVQGVFPKLLVFYICISVIDHVPVTPCLIAVVHEGLFP